MICQQWETVHLDPALQIVHLPRKSRCSRSSAPLPFHMVEREGVRSFAYQRARFGVQSARDGRVGCAARLGV
jgi:hypothetical protein